MAQKRRPVQPNKRQVARAPQAAQRHSLASYLPATPVAPVTYGKPFIVAEDENKNTFFYQAGAWVPYGESIAECRKTCLVTELPQRLNKMIRYEVRSPQ